MDDLISRQAAIDIIDLGRLGNSNEPRWSDNEIIAFLKSRPSVWEIFDVCPPEEDGVYIVTDCTGEVFPAEYDAEGEEVGRLFIGTKLMMHWTDIDTGEGLLDGEVTAWMKLPDPFEG